ncbi:hypothetical protein NHP190003_03400 [Helicobacter sp. NHP19-003]|uniref:Uncharacterized protein n=1 Tax=Helicobacter gastrocanis TaxID=2849641 RepID=A0ABM7S930_9HELI|nr:hypothetical protein [Helicobacter sp. NHP19-003]BCZ17058.1 hypothetical protein NHP190003_03400 [Helicobacter sp. NHP19-003]
MGAVEKVIGLSVDRDFMRKTATRAELCALLGLDTAQFRYLEQKGVFAPIDLQLYTLDKQDKTQRIQEIHYYTRESVLNYMHYLQVSKEMAQEDLAKLRGFNNELISIDRELRSELTALQDSNEKYKRALEREAKLLERNRALRHRLKEVDKDARAWRKLKDKEARHANYVVDVHECARFFGIEDEGGGIENALYYLRAKGAIVAEGDNLYHLQKSAIAMLEYTSLKAKEEAGTRDASSASTDQLSNILGVTPSRIYKLAPAGVTIKNSKDDWDLVASVRNYIAYKLETEKTDLQSARARKELADAKIKELNYQQKMGELLDFDTIAKALQDIASTISNKLYSLPQILKRKCAMPQELEGFLCAQIEAILEELQDPAIYERAADKTQELKEKRKEKEDLGLFEGVEDEGA